MKDFKLIIKDDFYLRIPRFSTRIYNEYHNASNENIMEFYKNNFKEEVLVESRELFDSCELNTQDINQLATTLRKYIIRSSARCTPFGLNATVLRGKFDKNNNLYIDTNLFQKEVYIDYEWYIKIIGLLEKIIGDKLYITLNNTIKINDEIILNIWIDSYRNNLTNAENIVLANTNAFKKIFHKIKDKFFSLHELQIELQNEYPNVSIDTIDNFLRELFDKQIIISDLKINTLCSRNLMNLVDKLKQYKIDDKFIKKIIEINDYLMKYKSVALGKGSDTYLKLIDIMKELSIAENYINVDLYNDSIIYLDDNLKKDIKQYVDLLVKFSDINGYDKDYFDKFINLFGNQAVDIFTVFDNCLGIGFPNKKRLEQNEKYNILERYIFDNYSDSININELLKNINTDSEFNISSIELSFNLASVISGKQCLISNQLLGSNQAYKILGRFHRYEKDYPAMDKDVDIVEIVYFPKKAKIANILNCSTNAKYYLEYGSHYDIDGMTRIKMSDIYIVPYGNRLRFINRSTNHYMKFIVSNMVNVAFMPLILQSLLIVSESEDYNLFNLFIMLNNIFKNHKLKPEIKCNDVVIQTKSMVINAKDDISIDKIKNYLNNKYVLCGNNDNYMLLNLEEQSNIDLLEKLVKTEKTLNIKDSFYAKHLQIKNEFNESYMSEFIFEIFFEKDLQKKQENKNIDYMMKCTYLEDDCKWYSFKLYMEKDFMNYFIKNHLHLILENNRQNNFIKKFFFIRYFDTDYHIRFRVLINKNDINSKAHIIDLYSTFLKLKESFIIKKVIIDEYIPEINRYGGKDVMNDVETIFMLSSTISMILAKNSIFNDKLLSERKYIYFVLKHIAYCYQSSDEQVSLMHRFNKFYKREKKYELLKKEIINKVINEKLSLQDITDDKSYIEINHKISILLKKVKSNINNDEIFNDILLSIFHMHFNRIVGINRNLENKLNSLIEHTLYSVKCIKKYKK